MIGGGAAAMNEHGTAWFVVGLIALALGLALMRYAHNVRPLLGELKP